MFSLNLEKTAFSFPFFPRFFVIHFSSAFCQPNFLKGSDLLETWIVNYVLSTHTHCMIRWDNWLSSGMGYNIWK